ncbi:MAG: M48 family metalloprotease [Planctomycetota bacterium]
MTFRFPTGGRRRPRRPGFGSMAKGRLLIAGAIALFAIVGFLMSGDENPITGKTQRVGLTEEQEVALGYQSKPQMINQMGGAHGPRSPKAEFLDTVGQVLLDRSGIQSRLDQEGIPWRFTFTLLEDDQTINAFALPGGPVFMTEALFDKLDNEAQIAGVLGHEIGHVIERHGAQRMAKEKLGQGLTQAAVVGTGDYSAAQIGQVVNGVIQSSYSRDQELESDAWGLEMMVDAGYDPREMIGVMQTLREASGDGPRGPQFMQTHPYPEDRIKAIEAWVARRFPDGVPTHLDSGTQLP